MNNPKLQTIGFFVLLGVAAILALLMLWPFLQLIALAAILAVLFSPWHKRITAKFKSQTWSALLTVLFVLVIVLVPLGLLGYLLYGEVGSLYRSIVTGGFHLDQALIVSRLPTNVQEIGNNFLNNLSDSISSLTGTTLQSVTGLVSNVFNFFFALFVVFFTLYYFLRDGSRLKEFISNIFPLSQVHESKLMERLEMAINGVVKGSFLVALTQGCIAFVGFLIFGVPQPLLWGALTVLAALVPTFGTSLALIPAILYLFLTGHTGAGIGMTIWGAVAVGTVDNIISPRLVGSRTNLHPLLVLFSVLGGLRLFGLLGFLLGPLLMAVLMVLLEMYQTDSKS